MSGLPHPFDESPGHDSKPVTHIIDWREDGVATVRWCGKKFLSDPLVLKKGETKLCPVCAIELRYDRQKKEVVEGGFPCVPNRTGDGMRELREVLEGLLTEDESVRLNVQVLAPIIEKALRAAYWEGDTDCKHGRPGYSDRGVTAGVAAMTEGP